MTDELSLALTRVKENAEAGCPACEQMHMRFFEEPSIGHTCHKTMDAAARLAIEAVEQATNGYGHEFNLTFPYDGSEPIHAEDCHICQIKARINRLKEGRDDS